MIKILLVKINTQLIINKMKYLMKINKIITTTKNKKVKNYNKYIIN